MPAATVDHSQRICEVWANNLDEELKRIRHVIRKYNYIAMVRPASLLMPACGDTVSNVNM